MVVIKRLRHRCSVNYLPSSSQNQKSLLYSISVIIMGMALFALSYNFGGSTIKDFFSGVLLGLGIGSMVVGVFFAARSIRR